MIKLFLPYNKTILKVNLAFSILLTILSGLLFFFAKSSHSFTHRLLQYYVVWVLTGGFLLAVYYFEISRKNEYYFYFNLGIGKIRLIFLAYCLNVIFVLPLIFVLLYV